MVGKNPQKPQKLNELELVIVDGNNDNFLMILMMFHVVKAFVYRYRSCHEILKSIIDYVKLIKLSLGLFLKP